ncbi:alpha-L-rhamnosidase N-terminal domain-containing protein [Bacillales bacterium AN1005]
MTADSSEIYGNTFALLYEMVVTYRDGSTEIIVSNDSWTAEQSQIKSGNLYDGEIYDATFQASESYPVREVELGYDRLKARLSLPVVIKEKRKPLEVIHTPAGETVLDMGQNMVGWIEYSDQRSQRKYHSVTIRRSATGRKFLPR